MSEHIFSIKEEVITPHFEKFINSVHPAVDFCNGVSYVGVHLRVTSVPSNMKGLEPGSEKVKKKFFLVSSSRDLILADEENLHKMGLELSCEPVMFEQKWEAEDIKRYLEGETVDAKKVFENVRNAWLEYLEFPLEVHYDFLALYTIGTYFHQLFSSYPYVYFGGIKQSGKTKALTLASCLCFNAVFSTSLSTSSLFRLVQGARCTLLMDESEKLVNPERAQDLRALLLSGYKKGGVVYRTEKTAKEKLVPMSFEVYCPKMLANIQGIEEVLQDRCITIIMRRAKNRQISDKEINIQDERWKKMRHELYTLFLQESRTFKEQMIDNTSAGSEGNARSEGTENIESKLSGRALELWKPIFLLAKYFDKFDIKPISSNFSSLYDEMLSFALEQEEERKTENMTETGEYTLAQVLVKVVKEDNFYKVKEIKEAMSLLFDEEQKWLTNEWVGRALKRLGFSEKRRIGTGIEVKLTVDKVKDLADRLGIPV